MELIERLRDESDLCRNETATDIADLLDEAINRIEALEGALRDAINSPKGVVPASAEPFYDAALKARGIE